ncbi:MULTISPECIES: ornithine carbamoyltransferase [Bacillota]|uniref:Ornithine carbamoyltransferase n=2 Tax=Amedibacillus TaxID=2749846 RepID=A0A7G9GMQ3_9FIRM|nr:MULTISPECIES: ornithine carbamoyltransferase [Bacillota]QNM12085.1 ornithine carbamoyltransferase [[Eubacterium] hominis]MCH4286562.1 ornithine carbamoyltransferase [Amedibacillus hominis]RGB53151.1 ornithine carbamoyltransferase [Absiella sp. AM22-9]RGB59441.1 ornithine carbamoyltransferase [Absiella sp. AM10-20]RGB66586.1 ornithine carbamoyltransferase [Absiella sp. AM09-45]
MKHLLTLADLTKEELYDLLDLADQLKKEVKEGVFTPYLKNKVLGMIFTKSSTRTRVSFEVGMKQLGGQGIYLNANDMQLGRGEPIKDTARVLSRYLDGIMIRTYKQSDLEELAEYGSIPIINGLTDYVHPCQVLADLQTIREHKGKLEGLKMCFIGAGNNMANSLINGGILAGMEVACACPLEYLPDEKIVERAKATGRFILTQDVLEAAKDADVLVTDVWASMGEEGEAETRKKIFGGKYQINDAVMEVAKPDAMVQHCLPAHREEEITEKVFEAHADEIFDEAENRLHAQKAVLVRLLGE